MPKDQAKQIERAVTAALERGDTDEASRLAAGHPDPSTHLKLMERINATVNQRGPDTYVDGTTKQPATPAVMFQLAQQPALLVSFNPRAERHGNETKPAADLKFEANLEAAKLDAFDPILRRMFYHKAGDASHNDLANATHEAPNLRVAKLVGPFKWSGKYAGYSMDIHIGTTGDHDVHLSDCEFNNITFDSKEGGTVLVGFRIQFHPENVADAGQLSFLVQNRVDITLTAPEGAREVVDEPST